MTKKMTEKSSLIDTLFLLAIMKVRILHLQDSPYGKKAPKLESFKS